MTSNCSTLSPERCAQRGITQSVSPPAPNPNPLKPRNRRRHTVTRAYTHSSDEQDARESHQVFKYVDLQTMLEQVVCGAYTITQFSTHCKIYKARARVQVAILSNDSINLDSWTVAQERFPKTCSPNIVDLWAQYIMKNSLKQKQAMPPQFSKMIERLIHMDEALSRSQTQLASVKLISLILMKLMSTNIFS